MRSTTAMIALVCAAGGVGSAFGQTCPRPVENCSGALHCGGEWDFEAGFYFTAHHLAGQCGSPPGGGNQSCVPANKTSQVGNGWVHWASFPTWPTSGYWGTVSFNENKNCDNVYRGNRSQELTMTCANGVGVIYKSAAVPVNHRLRVEAYMKFTPNGTTPPVEHSLGIDPTGGVNPNSPGIVWAIWQELTPSPPQPGGVFNRGTVEAVSVGSSITVFIRQRAFEPPCQGQTFMIDAVRVIDLGPNEPEIHVQPSTLEPTATAETSPGSQTFFVQNSGGGTLSYSISDDADWLSVLPDSGTSTGESDAITVTYASAGLPIGTHTGVVTIGSANALNSPQTIGVTLTVRAKPGDLDHDGDVDQADFAVLQRCFSGEGVVQSDALCLEARLDTDMDVDQGDLQVFLNCMNGPGVPSSPTCAGGI